MITIIIAIVFAIVFASVFFKALKEPLELPGKIFTIVICAGVIYGCIQVITNAL